MVSATPRNSQSLLPADAIAQALEAWFRRHGKSYPWRETHDPYAIVVSELMLQQTQIKNVLERGYYHRWMTAFPDVATLAAASEDQVLSVWQGLGYYRRARFLHAMAQTLMTDHGGQFPSDEASLRKLPGIGDYTTGAVLSFAFNQPQALVDGNVARVLTRLCNDDTPIDSTAGQKILWDRAKALIEFTSEPRIHNAAIMELGQQICRPGTPLCSECPVKTWCRATSPELLPVKAKKQVITEVDEPVAWVFEQGRLLLHQETGTRRKGLWKLPRLDAVPESAPLLLKSKYAITRYKVHLQVYEMPSSHAFPDSEPHRWVDAQEIAELPMPSPYRRAVEKLWLEPAASNQPTLSLL